MIFEKEIIWFNGNSNEYQKGSRADFEQLSINHPSKENLKLLFEFNSTSIQMIDKVLDALIKSSSSYLTNT